LRESWPDMDCAAGKYETDLQGYSKRLRLPSRMLERHTCFRSESISSSFCLSCARRYSRLLNGKNEHPSSSGEEGEDAWERFDIRESGTGTGRAVFPKHKSPHNMDATEGSEVERMAHFGALLGFRPSTIQSCLPCLQRLHTFSPGRNRHFI
jgi:hypothetical protein